MIRKTYCAAALGLVLVSLLGTTGCNPAYGPRLGIFAYPIPVSPYLQKCEEDKFWDKERYKKVPILEPLTPNGPTIAMDPPTQDEVMRALEKAHRSQGGVPLLHEIQRNNVRIVVEPIADFIDPPREIPLIGPAQLHHARYKCTVYYSEVTRVGWPIPYTTVNEDAREVIYIDHDHFHRVGGGCDTAMPGSTPGG